MRAGEQEIRRTHLDSEAKFVYSQDTGAIVMHVDMSNYYRDRKRQNNVKRCNLNNGLILLCLCVRS